MLLYAVSALIVMVLTTSPHHNAAAQHASNGDRASTDAAAPHRICDASGYCSLSLQPSHYVGPIEINRDLRQALQALAFRNEIIIAIENRPDYAAQFIANFQKAGCGCFSFARLHCTALHCTALHCTACLSCGTAPRWALVHMYCISVHMYCISVQMYCMSVQMYCMSVQMMMACLTTFLAFYVHKLADCLFMGNTARVAHLT